MDASACRREHSGHTLNKNLRKRARRPRQNKRERGRVRASTEGAHVQQKALLNQGCSRSRKCDKQRREHDREHAHGDGAGDGVERETGE